MLILENPTTLQEAQNQRDELAKALYAVLVMQKVLNTDGVVTGPHLLMAVDDLKAEHGFDANFTEENLASPNYGGGGV